MAAEAPPAEAEAPTEAMPVRASAEPRSPDPGPAAEGAPAAKAKGKDKGKGKGKDGKKGGKDAAPAAPEGTPTIAAYPRAARSVARAKSWGGLVGFLLGGYLSMPTNTLAEAGLRALIAGVVCYVVVWAAAVFAWRRLIAIEIKGREQQLANAAAGGAELPAGAGPGRDAARRR